MLNNQIIRNRWDETKRGIGLRIYCIFIFKSLLSVLTFITSSDELNKWKEIIKTYFCVINVPFKSHKWVWIILKILDKGKAKFCRVISKFSVVYININMHDISKFWKIFSKYISFNCSSIAIFWFVKDIIRTEILKNILPFSIKFLISKTKVRTIFFSRLPFEIELLFKLRLVELIISL